MIQIDESKSIVKQFLETSKDPVYQERGLIYSGRNACEFIRRKTTDVQFEKMCKEMELLLEMRECVFSKLKQWEDDGDRNNGREAENS